MRKKLLNIMPWIIILIIFIIGYKLAAYFQSSSDISTTHQIVAPQSCQFNLDGCHMKLNGGDVYIQVSGDVTPLKAFMINLQGIQIESAMVSFSMRDMDMGVNRFSFAETGYSQWETKVMLPICTVRRNDWIADFTIKYTDGKSFLIQFPFNTQ